MPNAARGEVEVPGVGVIRYDWNAIANLIAEFGEDFDTAISTAAQKLDVDVIARAAAIGMVDTTAEDIKAAAPPIVPTVAAVLEALNLAFHGQREAPPAGDGTDSNPTRAQRRSSSKRGAKRTEQV